MPIYDIDVRHRAFENVVVFVMAHVEERSGGRIDALEMYSRYTAWCDEVGCYAKQSLTIFGRIATDMGIEKVKLSRVKRMGVAWREPPLQISTADMTEFVLRPTVEMHIERQRSAEEEQSQRRAENKKEREERLRADKRVGLDARQARLDLGLRTWATRRLCRVKSAKPLTKFWFSDYYDWCEEEGHERLDAKEFSAALVRAGYPVVGAGMLGICAGFDLLFDGDKKISDLGENT